MSYCMVSYCMSYCMGTVVQFFSWKPAIDLVVVVVWFSGQLP